MKAKIVLLVLIIFLFSSCSILKTAEWRQENFECKPEMNQFDYNIKAMENSQKYFYGPFVPESVLYRETSYKLKLEYTIANKIAIKEAKKEEQKKIAKKSGVKKNKYKKKNS